MFNRNLERTNVAIERHSSLASKLAPGTARSDLARSEKMRISFVAIVAGILLASTIINSCQGTSQTSGPPSVMAEQTRPDAETRGLMQDKAIVAIYRWNVSDQENESELLCVFRKFDHDPKYPERGTKLSIYDSAGSLVYEDLFSTLSRFYPVFALGTDPSQLAIEVGYGGSGTYFLQLLDYHQGKIRTLLNPKENEFNVMAEIKSQFRAGVVSMKEPFEIRLTRGVGLASPVEKRTSVFRYVSGAYHYVGDYSKLMSDEFIEDQMKKGLRK